MKNPGAIRVVIADDHPVVREGLAALVDRCQDMTVVAQAVNGREAVEQVIHHRPDIVLMDLRMPEMGGVEAILTLRERIPDVRVVVLTVYDDDEDIYNSLRAGAKAYLLKDAPGKQLLDCLRAVHEGKTTISPAVAAKLASHVSNPDLTPRELEILKMVARGLSNKEIGQALEITDGTVKVHVTHLLAKLGVDSRTAAINVALQRGLVRLRGN